MVAEAISTEFWCDHLVLSVAIRMAELVVVLLAHAFQTIRLLLTIDFFNDIDMDLLNACICNATS